MDEEKTLRERISELEKWQEQATAQIESFKSTLDLLDNNFQLLVDSDLRGLGATITQLSNRVKSLEDLM